MKVRKVIKMKVNEVNKILISIQIKFLRCAQHLKEIEVIQYKFNAIFAGRKRKKGGQGGGSNGNHVKCFFLRRFFKLLLRV